MWIDWLPAVNASLNGTASFLLLVGHALIRRGRYRLHAGVMAMALACSALFLTSYLIHKAHRPPRSFGVQGAVIRPVYYAILGTHTVGAVAILPLVATVLAHAIGRRWDRHRRWARWTLPIWLYVSATGVVIYWMLYHLGPAT